MTKYWFIPLLMLLLACSGNGEYITQTETRTENNNGIRNQIKITKKLRRHDKLPVSILVESKSKDASFEGLDSIHYDASGKTLLTQSFEKRNGKWVLEKTRFVHQD